MSNFGWCVERCDNPILNIGCSATEESCGYAEGMGRPTCSRRGTVVMGAVCETTYECEAGLYCAATNSSAGVTRCLPIVSNAAGTACPGEEFTLLGPGPYGYCR